MVQQGQMMIMIFFQLLIMPLGIINTLQVGSFIWQTQYHHFGRPVSYQLTGSKLPIGQPGKTCFLSSLMLIPTLCPLLISTIRCYQKGWVEKGP